MKTTWRLTLKVTSLFLTTVSDIRLVYETKKTPCAAVSFWILGLAHEPSSRALWHRAQLLWQCRTYIYPVLWLLPRFSCHRLGVLHLKCLFLLFHTKEEWNTLDFKVRTIWGFNSLLKVVSHSLALSIKLFSNLTFRLNCTY